MIGRRRVSLLLLLLLAVGTGWLLQQVDRTPSRQHPNSTASPDYYIENFQMTTMDEHGQPRRRLEAAYMAYFSNTDVKDLTQPYLILYQPEQPAWHVRSQQARISADNRLIDLLGEVELWREGIAGTRELEIETRDLTVHTDAEYGETRQPAVIRTLRSESHGIGMQAFLKESRLILQSQVRTRYEANRR